MFVIFRISHHMMSVRALRASCIFTVVFGGLFAAQIASGADVPPAPGSATVNGMAPYEVKLPDSDAGFKMLPIPAGIFKMGSPESEKGRKADEGPQFDVKMDAFYMGETAITWDAYSQFLANYQRIAGQDTKLHQKIPQDKLADAVTYPTPMYDMEAGPALQRMGGRKGKFPAVIMSQFAAKQFTKWLSKKTGRFYRLPTEAEWEYACRAGTSTAYSFGDDAGKDGAILKEYSWYIDNSNLADGDGGYRLVASKKPNPWGLYDMHGDVANWCLDQYDKDWYKQFAGKTVGWHEVIDWPTSKTQYPRVIRGGSYQSEPEKCRSAARDKSDKELNVRDPQLPKSPYWQTEGFWLGFRVVSPAVEPSEAEKLRFWEADDEVTKSSSTRDRDLRDIVTPPQK